MAKTWKNSVRHVRNGEPVSAPVDGRPTRDLEGMAQYLKERVDDAALGEAIVRHRVTIAPEVVPGTPVYWDPDEERFAPAMVSMSAGPGGALVIDPQSYARGICGFKHNATLGDIVLGGSYEVDLSSATDEDPAQVPPGQYYLSTSTAGKLVLQKPPISIPVCYYDGERAYVNAVPRNFLDEHVHYRIPLFVKQAVDDLDTGWLAANHASFNGRAPIGAAYGYNINTHPELKKIFPPVPVEASLVVVDRGANHLGGTIAPQGVTGLVVVNRWGIWWMPNCTNDKPWVEGSANGQAPPATPTPGGPACPRPEVMQITLYATSMLTDTSKTAVSSLQPADGSPIVITNCDGDPASIGDLMLALHLVMSNANLPGSLVVKELTGQGTFRQGRVTEGLIAGANCTLTATHTRTEDDDTIYQGIVTVDVNLAPAERELQPEIIRLGAGQERYHYEIPYLALDKTRNSNLRFKFIIPPSGLPTNAQMKLRCWLFGRTAGTLPPLAASYRIMSRPDPGAAAVIPKEVQEIALPFNAGQAIGVDQYIEVESDPIAVTAGDTVYVFINRVTNDGYAGEVGLLRYGGIISAAQDIAP